MSPDIYTLESYKIHNLCSVFYLILNDTERTLSFISFFILKTTCATMPPIAHEQYKLLRFNKRKKHSPYTFPHRTSNLVYLYKEELKFNSQIH